MKIAVFKKPDGSLSYRTPVWPMLEKETEAEYFDRTEARERQAGSVLPDWVRVTIIDTADLPQHHGFRNAMTYDGSIKADMGKARELHRDHMRDARAPLLAALDIKQLRGEDVEAEKQALRDVTSDPSIDSAKTLEELKAVWPDTMNNFK